MCDRTCSSGNYSDTSCASVNEWINSTKVQICDSIESEKSLLLCSFVILFLIFLLALDLFLYSDHSFASFLILSVFCDNFFVLFLDSFLHSFTLSSLFYSFLFSFFHLNHSFFPSLSHSVYSFPHSFCFSQLFHSFTVHSFFPHPFALMSFIHLISYDFFPCFCHLLFFLLIFSIAWLIYYLFSSLFILSFFHHSFTPSFIILLWFVHFFWNSLIIYFDVLSIFWYYPWFALFVNPFYC